MIIVNIAIINLKIILILKHASTTIMKLVKFGEYCVKHVISNLVYTRKINYFLINISESNK